MVIWTQHLLARRRPSGSISIIPDFNTAIAWMGRWLKLLASPLSEDYISRACNFKAPHQSFASQLALSLVRDHLTLSLTPVATMRVASLVALSLLYGVTAVVGRAVNVVRPLHGTSSRNSIISTRHSSSGLDVCAALNTVLVVGDVAFGQVSACLCLSTAGSYIKSNLNATTVARISPVAVETRLQSLVSTSLTFRVSAAGRRRQPCY